MYESIVRRRNRPRHRVVARERAAAYDTDGALRDTDEAPSAVEAQRPPTLAEALAALDAAIDGLASVDLGAGDDRELLEATVTTQRLANRLAGQQVRGLRAVLGRGAFVEDGAVTLASWWRTRTRQDAAEASRWCTAARRLVGLPKLRDALLDGDVTLRHVTAVTSAAIPRRMAAIQQCEDDLVRLARDATPADVATAVRAIADQVDPDGSDPDPLDDDGPDERRDLRYAPTIDGLFTGQFTLDAWTFAMLATAIEACDFPDPADTPPERRRSAGQRRADALAEALRRLLAADMLPSVNGSPAKVLLTMDLLTLLRLNEAATRTPRLRFAGAVSPAVARRIAAQATIMALVTMGPWRVVNVGRAFRTLPPWLRAAMEMVHRHCRGPDCDRPAVWTEAHHARGDWADGADTDLAATVPLCKAHHDLVTSGGWTVAIDPDTAVCTWTSPGGWTRVTYPPAP